MSSFHHNFPNFRLSTWGTLTQSLAVRVGVRSTLPQLMTTNLRSHKASSSQRCNLDVRDILNQMKDVTSPDSKISAKEIPWSDTFGPLQSRRQHSEVLLHPTKQIQANRRLRSFQHQAFQQKQIKTLRHMKDNSDDFSELINQNLATQQSIHAIPEISKNQSCEQKSSKFQIQDHAS